MFIGYPSFRKNLCLLPPKNNTLAVLEIIHQLIGALTFSDLYRSLDMKSPG